MRSRRRVLVTGATGFVGGRLIPRLLTAGIGVRVPVRDVSRIAGRSRAGSVEVTVGDVVDRESTARTLDGVDQACRLVHSTLAPGFEDLDPRAIGDEVEVRKELFSCFDRSFPTPKKEESRLVPSPLLTSSGRSATARRSTRR